MPRYSSTKLRFASGSSSEELEAIINSLPFKVELKTIAKDGKKWVCWFVLPDNISHDTFNRVMMALELKMRQSKQLTEAEIK